MVQNIKNTFIGEKNNSSKTTDNAEVSLDAYYYQNTGNETRKSFCIVLFFKIK